MAILRPQVKLVKVPIVESYGCVENKKITNPNYEVEKKVWIDKCLENNNGIFASTECAMDALTADIKEPLMVEEKVSAICNRKIGTNNSIKLDLYGENKYQLVLFSYQSK